MAAAPSVDDYTFGNDASAGADTYPCEAGQIRKGGLIMVKGRPCKVSEVSVSKTGKHGHAKCNFTTYDIFTDKKLEDMIPSTHGTTVPNVKREEYTLMSVAEDDFMTIMDENGDIREDLKLPKYPESAAEDLTNFLQTCEDEGKDCVVTVQVFGNRTEEMVISWKQGSDKARSHRQDKNADTTGRNEADCSSIRLPA